MTHAGMHLGVSKCTGTILRVSFSRGAAQDAASSVQNMRDQCLRPTAMESDLAFVGMALIEAMALNASSLCRSTKHNVLKLNIMVRMAMHRLYAHCPCSMVHGGYVDHFRYPAPFVLFFLGASLSKISRPAALQPLTLWWSLSGDVSRVSEDVFCFFPL